MNHHCLARATVSALLGLAALAAQAQDPARIVAATVYPDSARVERELKVPGGTRHVVLACVPGGIDLATLQVTGDPELRVGEIRSTPLPATRASECAPSPIESRQKALDLRKSQLEAQRDSNELALSYLKVWGSSPHADDRSGTPPAAAASRPGQKAPQPSRPGALSGDLRQAALDLLVDQARVKRELADLERDGDKLSDEVPPERGKGNWRTVRVDVWTPAATTLHLYYNVNNTYWRPTYRATLDTAHTTLRIDRQADIVQASGEDWSDVHVKLSTGRVHRSAHAPEPSPWSVDLLPPVTPAFASAPAIDNAVQRVEITASTVNRLDETRTVPPPWGANTVSNDYVTEFDVNQAVTLASDGETHTLQLASQTLPATMKRRTTPRLDNGVYLYAQAERPEGVWPDGPVQAWLDGTLVGRSNWTPAHGAKLQVALGRDAQMHVDVESPGLFTQSRGVFGSSFERSATAVYAIVNQHREAVAVEMLDASPVSRNEAIQVTNTYSPQPSATDWNKVPGATQWLLTIPAHETTRVSVSHTVTAPKDARVTNLP